MLLIFYRDCFLNQSSFRFEATKSFKNILVKFQIESIEMETKHVKQEAVSVIPPIHDPEAVESIKDWKKVPAEVSVALCF